MQINPFNKAALNDKRKIIDILKPIPRYTSYQEERILSEHKQSELGLYEFSVDRYEKCDIKRINLFFYPLSINISQNTLISDLTAALLSRLDAMPKWFIPCVKCYEDNTVVCMFYHEDFGDVLRNGGPFALDYAAGTVCFDAYFMPKKGATFADLAAFLSNWSKNWQRVLDGEFLRFYSKKSVCKPSNEQISAEISSFEKDLRAHRFYKFSPAQLLSKKDFLFDDMLVGCDFDNLYNCIMSGFIGIEDYEIVFNDDYDRFDYELEVNAMRLLTQKPWLPRNLKLKPSLNVSAFAKAVHTNAPLCEWIKAGVCGFDEWDLVENANIDEIYYQNLYAKSKEDFNITNPRAIHLTNGIQSIKLSPNLRYLDLLFLQGKKVFVDIAKLEASYQIHEERFLKLKNDDKL